MKSRLAIALSLTLLAAVAALAVSGTQAPAATCAYPATYPGDAAPKAAIAAWMAGGATEAGLPGELPVMAALVESGMTNLSAPDSDSAGYFQMPLRIWNSGDYAGYPSHPELQLQWFIDKAQAVRQQRIAAGNTGFGSDPATWGDWVADIERPAVQYRYRYALHLDDARALIAAGCQMTPPPDTTTDTQPTTVQDNSDAQLVPDSVLPSLRVVAHRYQDAARRGRLAVDAVCANETCLARATAGFALPGRGIFRLVVPPVEVRRGRHRLFRLVVPPRARRAVAASLAAGVCPLATVRVVAANAGGYRISASRTVLLGPAGRCA